MRLYRCPHNWMHERYSASHRDLQSKSPAVKLHNCSHSWRRCSHVKQLAILCRGNTLYLWRKEPSIATVSSSTAAALNIVAGSPQAIMNVRNARIRHIGTHLHGGRPRKLNVEQARIAIRPRLRFRSCTKFNVAPKSVKDRSLGEEHKKRFGSPRCAFRLTPVCSLPLTAVRRVSLIVAEMGDRTD